MTDEVDLRDTYRQALEAAGMAYKATNRAGYTALLATLMAGYTGKPGDYRHLMGELQRRCALAGGFPSTFEQWRDNQPALGCRKS